MNLTYAIQLVMMLWGTAELVWAVARRITSGAAESRDRRSGPLIWGTIAVSLAVGFLLQADRPAPIEAGTPLYASALVLLLLGIGLRWWAILTLGRLFTFTVKVHADHQLVRRGPYAWIRHPSYTGCLLAFLALGLALADWVALAAVTLPITAAFVYRIRVEERALVERLGAPYEEYRRSTNRLVPWIY